MSIDSPRFRAWSVAVLLMVVLGGVVVVGISLATDDSVADAATNTINWGIIRADSRSPPGTLSLSTRTPTRL